MRYPLGTSCFHNSYAPGIGLLQRSWTPPQPTWRCVSSCVTGLVAARVLYLIFRRVSVLCGNSDIVAQRTDLFDIKVLLYSYNSPMWKHHLVVVYLRWSKPLLLMPWLKQEPEHRLQLCWPILFSWVVQQQHRMVKPRWISWPEFAWKIYRILCF